jgi:hypothetical protein
MDGNGVNQELSGRLPSKSYGLQFTREDIPGHGRLGLRHVTVTCDHHHSNIAESSPSVTIGVERYTMAQNQQQALLNALKLELEFCEQSGYQTLVGRLPARASENDPISTFLFDERKRECRKERSIFQDSPSCLNYGLPVREHPCSECWLIDFVPAEKRGEAIPCHHIPLNERGDSVATLREPGDAPDVQEAVVGWLRGMIQQLEGELAQSQQPAA